MHLYFFTETSGTIPFYTSYRINPLIRCKREESIKVSTGGRICLLVSCGPYSSSAVAISFWTVQRKYKEDGRICPSNYFSVLQSKDDPACSLIDDILLSDLPQDIFWTTKNCSSFKPKDKSQEIRKRVQVNFFEFPSLN